MSPLAIMATIITPDRLASAWPAFLALAVIAIVTTDITVPKDGTSLVLGDAIDILTLGLV
jgi:hypothetical protein